MCVWCSNQKGTKHSPEQSISGQTNTWKGYNLVENNIRSSPVHGIDEAIHFLSLPTRAEREKTHYFGYIIKVGSEGEFSKERIFLHRKTFKILNKNPRLFIAILDSTAHCLSLSLVMKHWFFTNRKPCFPFLLDFQNRGQSKLGRLTTHPREANECDEDLNCPYILIHSLWDVLPRNQNETKSH